MSNAALWWLLLYEPRLGELKISFTETLIAQQRWSSYHEQQYFRTLFTFERLFLRAIHDSVAGDRINPWRNGQQAFIIIYTSSTGSIWKKWHRFSRSECLEQVKRSRIREGHVGRVRTSTPITSYQRRRQRSCGATVIEWCRTLVKFLQRIKKPTRRKFTEKSELNVIYLCNKICGLG